MLQATMSVNELGNLTIAGCDSVTLAQKYGTPLYVMDVDLIRHQSALFTRNFRHKSFETEVIYASKAFLTLAMCRLVEELGLSLDVVSGGELYTAIKAGFPASRIYFHGNNKTVEELIMALQYGVSHIIVDNRHEASMLNYLCAELDKSVDVLVRINTGIEAHTHDYIKTTGSDSKFGLALEDSSLITLIQEIQDAYYLNLQGFHYHIGSQILALDSYLKSMEVVVEFLDRIRKTCSFETKVLNMGGGFGVYYSEEDDPLDIEACMKQILSKAEEVFTTYRMPRPRLLIEPGRSIVANAGTTLYKVGATKKTDTKHYVFVDGGMTDNPRTALYDAVYEAVLANRVNDANTGNFVIAGKCCESGDIIIRDISLPEPKNNDILAVFTTGAYNYSMASNYNRLRKPAVVFVENGRSKVVVKRETYEDLIRNDL